MLEEVEEELLSMESSAPLSIDNDYVKMYSQWTRELEEMTEEIQQLKLTNMELEKENEKLHQEMLNAQHRARALEAERDLALKVQMNRERQFQNITEEHKMEVQELQERILFLERKLESSESGRELKDRVNYLEQKLVSRETEVKLLMQQNREQLSTSPKGLVQEERREQEIEKQRLLLEKTELERSLDDMRSDGIRKDREISRLSRSLEEMDKELELMKSLLQPTPKSVSLSPPRSRRGSKSKTLSKRLSWLIGGPRPSASVESQPVAIRSSGQHAKQGMVHARSLDTLDLPPPPTSLKIHWHKKGTVKAPTNRLVRGAAVVDRSTIYLSSYLNSTIWGYKSAQGQWFTLPECPAIMFAMAMVNGCLTVIGGQRSHGDVEPTNQLVSFVAEEHKLWVELNGPMPTKRINATAVTTESVLIVAGGANTKKLDAVEIMNLATKQWSVAMSLPRPIESMSSAYCPETDRMFLMGGDEDSGPMRVALTCSIDKLLHSCARFNRIHDSSEVWEMISELQADYPTCLVIKDHLLALGGIEKEKQQDSKAVYDYDFSTKSWKLLSHIPSPTHKLIAAMLPRNRLMVLGGFTKVNISDDVYFADVIFE